jgi:crotonobetainyl-CoA:carnitine CoA-transferase CaiB-like acyl-CoA transferase
MPSESITVREGALRGVRVLDLSTSVAGLQATGHLADNGAEVVFVEPPGGSRWRRHPSWPLWGRGKSSLEIDIRLPEGSARLREMAADFDVVVDTFRPGVARRLGLDYGSLAAGAPHLIHGSVTGFGTEGRYAHVKAYEGVVMAALGIMDAYSVLHERPGPAFASPWMCSASASQVLLHGILSALYERESSGLGQHVETSLLEAVATQDLNNFTHLFLRRRFPDAFDDVPFISKEGVPNSGMAFRTLVALTSDGHWLQFGQLSERLFRAMMRALELDWMYDDPRWAAAPEFDDPKTRMQFWEHLLEAARKKTLAEWRSVFDADDDVWAEVYRDGPGLLHHPQLIHDGRVASVIDGTGQAVRAPGALVVLDGTPGPTHTAPPALGDFVLYPTEGGSADRQRESVVQPADGARSSTPLSGITIVELGMYFAGPLGATMLADLGARVIKVEPLEGDPGRSFTGFPEAGGTRTMQGKESVAVDMSNASGRQVVADLVARADVVLQSFRPGVARRMGLDARGVANLNPEAIYVEAPGYGSAGPCAGKPSFAPTMGAASGFALRNVGAVPTDPDLPLAEIKKHAARLFPATIIVGHADAFAAHAVATAILLGLVARKRGQGAQRLETTMLATMSHVLSDQMVEAPERIVPYAADEQMLGLSALYRLYECADGWVFLAVTTEKEWEAFRAALGHRAPSAAPGADLDVLRGIRTPEPAYAPLGALLADELEKVFLERTTGEWEATLLSADVACVRVADSSPAEVLMDNLLEIPGGLTDEVIHPLWDEHPRLKPAVRFSRSTTVSPGGCTCGQHTDELLKEVGYTEQQIDDLRQANIVG